ncbi:MAG: DUF3473 domain-containing protein [Gammaproteobacteria bacterium]|nr:DUF3473 domain-containing protein [Gammaproteobacteria bacterium]
MPLTFTVDLEEHRPNETYSKRFPAIMRDILTFLEGRNVKATVFVLGKLAENDSGLIKEIADAGHEIGFHSYAHVHLNKDTAENFKQESHRSKAFMEDLTGQAIYGFRAPAFSLTRQSLWVQDVLQELGFSYSSSVLPANNPINGFPGAPAKPFLWSNGIIEIPAPLAKIGPLSMPYLGGIYLRYLPIFLINHFVEREPDQRSLWLYCHPHDFDHGESYYTIEGTSMLTSLLLWFNRKNTFNKIDQVMSEKLCRNSMPFIEAINAGKYEGLEVFNPGCEIP